MKIRDTHVPRALILGACSLCAFAAANADTITWSETAATTAWATGTNWDGGVAPAAGDDVVIFGSGNEPTNSTGYDSIAINSLTLVPHPVNGDDTVSVGGTIQVGAGGVFNNMATNSLNISAELTADQSWGGTRTIFVKSPGIAAASTGKMTFEGSAIRFDVDSPSWTTGLDARGTVQMNGYPAASATVTPWGTGTINLINQRTDGTTNVTAGVALAAGATNVDLATANTLANDIVLQEVGGSTNNFTISQNNNASQDAGTPPDHHYILTGVISGAVDTARTLTFSNGRSNSGATFVLANANTFTARTVLSGSNPLALVLDNVDALQNSTLDMGSASAPITFTVAGANTYNLGGLTGGDDLDFGANTLNIGSNGSDGILTGVLSGSGNIIKTGAGKLTLSGANTYTGTTTVNGGTLVASTPASLPGYDSAASVVFDGGTIGVSVGAGGWLDADLNDLLTNATKTSGSVGIDTTLGDFTQTSAYNFSPLGLGVTGANQLTLNQANTVASTTFEGDSILVAAAGALGTGAVTGTDNAVLTIDTPSDVTLANDITLATLVDSGIVNNSATSVVTLSGNVELDGGGGYGALIGTGVNNAGFVISGTLTSALNKRMGIKDTNLTLTSTGSVVYNGFQRVTLAESGGDGAAVYLEDGAILDTRIQDSNNRDVTAGKTFIVGMTSAGTGTFSGNSGVSVDLVKRATSAANDWEFTAPTDATAIFSGNIISSGGIASTIDKTGAGTVIFAGNNTYPGSTTISEGTLQIGNGGATGKLSTTSTIVNNGALAFNNTAAIVQGTDFSGDPITGTGSLSVLSGNVTLNAANTYSGGTTLDGGTLTIGAANAVPAGTITGTNGSAVAFNTPSDVTFSDDITLEAASNSGLVNASATSSVTIEGTVELTGGFTSVVGTGVANAGFVIANGGVLKAGTTSRLGLKDTSLTIENGGAVDYSGTGFKRLTLAEGGGAGAAVYLEDGVDLDMVIFDTNNGNVTSDTMDFTIGMASAGTATFSGLSGTAVNLNKKDDAASLSNDWKFTAVAGATANFTGAIVNTNTNNQSTITKTGDGTVVFQANNTYTGNTAVSAGTLQLASGGVLTFAPTANGVNTQISGTASGTLDLDGEIFIDLSGADTTNGNSWLLIDGSAMTVTYDATVNSSEGVFAESAGVWTLVEDGNTWTFTEATGILELANAGPSGPTDEEISSDEFVTNYSFDGTDANFSFSVFDGSTYEIRRTDDLTDPLASWTTVYGPTASILDETITPSDTPGLTEAFYVLIITDTP